MNYMKRKLLITLSLMIAGATIYGAAGKDFRKARGVIRIVQYNVGAFSKEIENSIPMISEMMKELEADAVSLNEVDSCNLRHRNNQLSDFAEAMGGWQYRFGCALKFMGGAYGVGVATGDEIIRSVNIPLPKGKGSEPRACCVVETKRYVLASTHLDYKSEDAAVAQAEIINARLKEMYSDSDKAVLLSGDMNFEPGSAVLQTLKKEWDVLTEPSASYPADNPRSCIDYILILRNRARVSLKATAVSTRFESGDVKVASDHLPVYVDITM